MKYGLIGEKLGHSFSVSIHNSFGNPDYELREIPRDELDAFRKERDFAGINVTIPYKQDVMKYCILDDAAKQIGAVNTIVNRNGVLYGYNTDAYGLSALIDRTMSPGSSTQFGDSYSAVILGAGGTCKTAIYVLEQKRVSSIYVLARDTKKAEETLKGKNVTVFPIEAGSYPDCVKNAKILINTTPVGMYPKADGVPVDLDDFTNLECVFDVVYNPLTTNLVANAKAKGISSANGLYMLVMQALKAELLFFEEEGGLHNLKVELPSHLSIPERYKAKRQKLQDEGERVYRELYLKQSDIVLIGMPGSGKSTLGRMLAERTGRKFVDTDEEFTQKFEMTPGDCIRTQGEDAFREKETQVVKEVAAGTGLVIATGGGVVTRPKNIELLKQNGEIVYINRDISNLSSNGRPLSQGDGAIEKLFEIRKPLYENAADYIVNAEEGKVDITCDSIESNFR